MSTQAQQIDNTPEGDNIKQVNLLDVEINSENAALNVMVALLNTAQKRGAFNMQESAKAWECVQKFMRTSSSKDDSKNVTMNVTEKDTV
tara:strand:- start:427 stop:693 length:267 start_codon:yes stop_codon:yes gene_type:complete